jgi:hypothetical protein
MNWSGPLIGEVLITLAPQKFSTSSADVTQHPGYSKVRSEARDDMRPCGILQLRFSTLTPSTAT